MSTLREHLEAIIVRGYCPTKDEDRADAVAALAILDNAKCETPGGTRIAGYRLVPDPPVSS